ncbi:MAG: exopolysaccharide biosynthesis protein [Armatimonadetes bacterium]|nr:exopolysaccharide biosynthesis protein [Armatimonadota bacterium]MDW8154651.1 exopolysaccharide biosynthesis protein [Armatimonadota bacterium]
MRNDARTEHLGAAGQGFVLLAMHRLVHVPPEERPLSELLEEALTAEDGRVITVREIADRIDERGFGFALILLALPTLIPVLPPGTSGAVGCLYVLLAIQMALGRERPWLPRRVLDYRLSHRAVEGLRSRGVRILRYLERFSRPRWTPIGDAALLRLCAAFILAMGVVLFLPLPFLNTLPGLAALAIGVGLLNRDGILLSVGIGIALFVLSLVGASAQALRGVLTWLLSLAR